MGIAVGIDIGTTTICACAVDADSGKVLETWTREHGFIQGSMEWEKLQSPEEILTDVFWILEDVKRKYAGIAGIGLTGQMHGILYVNSEGAAVSPLYTWQDVRGEECVRWLKEMTGYDCPAGYGSATHCYNVQHRMTPADAAGFCTIHGYLLMKLCKLERAVIHPSDAAGIGLYDGRTGDFDRAAIEKGGMDAGMFPDVSGDFQGVTDDGIPVAVGIGDNQASFCGAVREPAESVLVNMGTGSQVSVWSRKPVHGTGLEFRPYLEQDYLAAGSSLCGGRAYAVLERFFREAAELSGRPAESMYGIMNRLAENYRELAEPLEVRTTLCGTRERPELRGAIERIGIDNFTPAHLTVGFLMGCVEELYGMYRNAQKILQIKPRVLVGAGNGLRNNRALRNMISERFQMELRIPVHREEAAFGAALFSLKCCRGLTAEEAGRYIEYETVH